jgi:hypothetical protein
MTEEVWVLSAKIESFKKKFNSLSKKAKTLECEIPTLVITDETKIIQSSTSSGNLFSIKGITEYTKIIFTGEAPTLDEWKVIAKINHKKTENGYENRIELASLESDDLKQLEQIETFHKTPHCDHCETSRFRKSTFILKHVDTSEVVQVGSTCVEDFVRSSSLSSVLHYFSTLEFIRGNEDQSKPTETEHTYSAISLKDLIKITYLTISEYGFLNKRDAESAGERTSSAIVFSILNDTDLPDTETSFITKEMISSCEAEEIYTYITSELPSQPMNGFTANLINATKSGTVNIGNRYSIALIVGAIGGYLNKKEKEKSKKIAEAKFTKEHFGLIGQRSTYTLVFLDCKSEQNEYGVKETYFFTDLKYRKFKWVCWGNKPEIDFIKGNKYTIKGTISKHEDYSIPTTVINRCRDVKEVT